MRLLVIILLLIGFTSCASMKEQKSIAKSQKYKSISFPASYDEQVALGVNSVDMARDKNSSYYVSNELFLKASDAMLRNSYDKAHQYFTPLIKMFPKDDYIRKQYGVNLISLGKLEEAEDVFKDLYSKSNPSDDALGLVLAGIYTANEKKDFAKKVYYQIIKSTPGQEEACIFLAKSFASTKNYRKAHSLLRRCVKENNSAMFPYYQGKIELERENEKKALHFFDKSLKVDPLFFQAVMGIGLIHESKGRNKKAISIYKKFLKNGSENYSVLSRIVYILTNQANSKETVRYMERLSNLDPDDLNLKVRLGILYTDLNRIDDAKGVFNEILEVIPTSDKILYYLGALYQQTSEFDSAIDYYSRVSVKSPLFEDSNIQIGRILNVLALDEHREGSERGIKRLVDFVKDNSKKYPNLKVELSVILAGLYDDADRTDDAIALLEGLIDNESFDSDHKYFLALLYEKDNNRGKAIALLKNIVASEPENTDALNFLGYTLLEEGIELDMAFSYISKAVKLRPDDGYIRDSLGWYHYRLGQYEQALKELAVAWKLVGDDSVIAKHLAMAYERFGKLGQAEYYFKKALSFCKDESEKQEILQSVERIQSRRLPASE